MKKTVLITGASRGIGKAIALHFGIKGYQLILNSCHNQADLDEVARTCQSLGYPYITCLGNVGDPLFVKEMITAGIHAFNTIDILINNAGASCLTLLQDMSYEQWHTLMNTNLDSVFLCCKYTIPYMLQNKNGSILNITSVWGETGASYEVAYSASKGGINAFTKALGKELAPSNISVNAISCGMIDTAMNQCFSKEEQDSIIDEIPCGRMASPEEVAHFAYDIATGSHYVTGQILRIDGGWQ